MAKRTRFDRKNSLSGQGSSISPGSTGESDARKVGQTCPKCKGRIMPGQKHKCPGFRRTTPQNPYG